MPISKIELMDCMEGMKQYPDKYFDLAIVDPPYGIGYDRNAFLSGKMGLCAKKSEFEFKNWDTSPPPIKYFIELIRVSKNQIIWGANHFINLIPYPSPCWLVWDKDNGTTKFADCELAYTSFEYPVKKFKFTWNGMLQGDMKNKETRIHPTQKPVKLYEWCLVNFAKQGDKILDTHLGSQSSRIAAYKLGFDFWGFEIDKDYFEQGNQRFEKESKLICHNDDLF